MLLWLQWRGPPLTPAPGFAYKATEILECCFLAWLFYLRGFLFSIFATVGMLVLIPQHPKFSSFCLILKFQNFDLFVSNICFPKMFFPNNNCFKKNVVRNLFSENNLDLEFYTSPIPGKFNACGGVGSV